MTEVQIIEYFKGIAAASKYIAHKDVDKKRRFAGSIEEAKEGIRSKINIKQPTMVLQFLNATYENNEGELQLKYTPLNIFILSTCDTNNFQSQYQAWSSAAFIWEKILSKLLKDREELVGIRNFNKAKITIDYVQGEILESCYGLVAEIRIQQKADVNYYDSDWISAEEEGGGVGSDDIGGSLVVYPDLSGDVTGVGSDDVGGSLIVY
jgi:hypothetical protein